MFSTLAQLYCTCPHGWQMSAWNADNEEEMWNCGVAPKAPGRGKEEGKETRVSRKADSRGSAEVSLK